MVYVALGDVGVEIWALNEAEEQLVDDLQVRPSELENRLVLFWVEGVTERVDLGRYRPEQVG